MTRYDRHFAGYVLPLLLFSALSCGNEMKEDRPGLKQDTRITLALEFADGAIPEGESVSVYEIRGVSSSGSAVAGPQTTVLSAGSEVTVRFGKGAVGYNLVCPSLPESSILTLPSFDYHMGGGSFHSVPGEGEIIPVRMTRIGGCVTVTVKDLPEGMTVEGYTLTFPTDVAGGYKYDPLTGSAALIRNASRSISVPGPAISAPDAPGTASFTVRTGPCRLPSESEITLSAQSGTRTLMAESTLPSTALLEDGATLSLEMEMHSSVTYSNPVFTSDWPDPTVWYADGTFYSYSTMGSGLKKMLSSTDLVHWTSVGAPFSDGVNATLQGYGTDRWAPDVVRIGDLWMMYFTCRNSSSSGIIALCSDSPTGPFTVVGRITFSEHTGIRDSIDPEVVRDPETGRVWLFFGSTGKMQRVELDDAGAQVLSGAPYDHVAGLDISEDSSRDRVFEGAYLYHRNGWWYLFASAGQYWNHTYKVVVGRSRTLDGEFLDRSGRKMKEGYATSVLSSNDEDRFFGPGHNGEIFTDRLGHDYFMYHCHDRSRGKDSERYLMLQRLFWDNDGWPYVKNGKPCAEGYVPEW